MKLRTLCCLLLAMQACIMLRAQSLEGCVILNDTTPAAYATIYLPKLGIGTITDHDGRYLIADLPLGTHEVEYSHLGYRTVKRNLIIDREKRMAHDERLEEQPIKLNDVYVTPNGEDPAIYILSHVAEQAAANRKRLASYDASVVHTFHAQDVDFIPAILPSAVNFLIKTVVRAARMGAIYNLCTQNERVDARLSSEHHFAKGKTRYANEHVLSSTPALTPKATEQLFRLTHSELFDELYGEDLSYGSKAIRKGYCQYKLKGTIEEDGKVIDVLEYSRQHDGYHCTTTLYVIEDIWGILRTEFLDNNMYERTECRDIGGGIYLPISQMQDPKMGNINFDEMVKAYKEGELTFDQDMDKQERKVFERLSNYIENGRKLQPCMTSGYNIQYRNVVVK